MNTQVGVSPAQIQDAYVAACRLDVKAMKPGNVSEASAGHGMTSDDFFRSASASADAMSDPRLKLGQRIHRAVAATRAAVGVNTNLGIVLLCAPLAQAALSARPGDDLRVVLCRVLEEADIDDAEEVFAAIRLARPGGLGDADRHDVAARAQVPLRDAMAVAANRDRIAGQYASGFADLFGDALPRFRAVRPADREVGAGVLDLYLHLLSRYPDSHVARKHGTDAASNLQQVGAAVYVAWRSASNGEVTDRLLAFDQRLKQAGINPGTTADLTVATVFLDRLLRAAVFNTGIPRRTTWRHLRLASSGAPLVSTLLLGES
ncbi:MAG: triphosphoribosyl-dephospho-CoA synthase [Thiohalocapsa sp.]